MLAPTARPRHSSGQAEVVFMDRSSSLGFLAIVTSFSAASCGAPPRASTPHASPPGAEPLAPGGPAVALAAPVPGAAGPAAGGAGSPAAPGDAAHAREVAPEGGLAPTGPSLTAADG